MYTRNKKPREDNSPADRSAARPRPSQKDRLFYALIVNYLSLLVKAVEPGRRADTARAGEGQDLPGPLPPAAARAPRVEGRPAPDESCQVAGVGRATITGLVDGLEEAGLARRLPCAEDRRSIMVALTPKGIRLIDSLAPARLKRVSELMGGLTAAEKKEFTRLLDKVSANMPAFRKI